MVVAAGVLIGVPEARLELGTLHIGKTPTGSNVARSHLGGAVALRRWGRLL
jgi:hypothetical protein